MLPVRLLGSYIYVLNGLCNAVLAVAPPVVVVVVVVVQCCVEAAKRISGFALFTGTLWAHRHRISSSIIIIIQHVSGDRTSKAAE